ncbi:MAG: hypothetical protein GX334_08825 [Firmicutes bacterium]|nr:hypothetical protein [Bacillota bacterium]
MKTQMKLKVVRSLLLLALALILVIGGTTLSWFTAEFNIPSAAEMFTGKIAFEITAADVYTSESEGVKQEGENIAWEAGDDKEFRWIIKNTGSKNSFFRAQVKSNPAYQVAAGKGNTAPGSLAAFPANNQITWLLPADSAWQTGTANADNWYYYCRPVKNGDEITLVLNGRLSADAEDSTCTVQLQAEAVQASHGAAAAEWPHNPGQQE